MSPYHPANRFASSANSRRETTNLTVAMLPLLALFALSFPCWAVGNASASAAVFNSYCLGMTSDFATLDHRASEGRYKVVVDRSIPMPGGQVMRQKNWLIPSQGGASIMLTSNDVTNGSLHVFGCGIYAPDLDGAAMESALSALPRLGSPPRHSPGAGGATVTWWWARVGEGLPSDDSQVMLSRDVPGLLGVNVNLILKTHLDH